MLGFCDNLCAQYLYGKAAHVAADKVIVINGTRRCQWFLQWPHFSFDGPCC